jgi:hypothetical protein
MQARSACRARLLTLRGGAVVSMFNLISIRSKYGASASTSYFSELKNVARRSAAASRMGTSQSGANRATCVSSQKAVPTITYCSGLGGVCRGTTRTAQRQMVSNTAWVWPNR